MLFRSNSAKQRSGPGRAAILGLLAPGATVVLSDVTPERDGAGDPVRAFWLHHPELVASEVQVSPTEAVIVAVRAARVVSGGQPVIVS